MNFLRGTVRNGAISFGKTQLDLSKRLPSIADWEGKPIVLGFRPEAVLLGEKPDAYQIPCQVELTEMLGDNTNVYIKAGDDLAILKVDSHDTPENDAPLTFSIPYGSVYLFDGETEKVIGE